MKNKTESRSFSIITLGCPKNTVDSELITASLIDKGFQYKDNIFQSDYVIINTCGFIKPAVKQSLETITNLIETIQENNLSTKVIVSGCLVSRYGKYLVQKLDKVYSFYDTNSFLQIAEDLQNEDLQNEDNRQKNNKIKLRSSVYGFDYSYKLSKFISTGYYSYVKIAEGCNHKCSFCAIPLIRGKYKSRPIEDIIKEIEKLVKIGIKEIILVSQDTSFYGYDLYKKLSLSDLLRKIDEMKGDFWVRLHYLYPTTLNKEVIRLIANSEKIVKYIDIPFQHVSSRVLKAMRRPGNKDYYKNFVYELRKIIPDVVIRSTFIIGHPYEEEEDFQELLDFLSEVKIERAGFFKYYREKDTYSYTLPQVSYKIKQKRYNKVVTLQDEILRRWSINQIGKVFKVLVEYEDDNFYIGRAYFDSPEIDSVIKLHKSTKLNVGDFYKVRIIDYKEYDFYGECIS